ncbi:hypothetical protein ANTRET_LOCUS6066 [Anthophora retusa]
MTSVKTLPLLEGAKLIVLDEGLDALFARTLIAGWIQMWKVKDPSHTFDLLLFSDPKSSYQSEPAPFLSSNALWFLEKLNKLVPQIICIYRRDFIENKLVYIETLGSTHVKIEKFSGIQVNKNLHYIIEFIHRKVGGGILKQQELVNQSITSYEIQSEKLEQNKKSESAYENHKQKIESSFRIEINEKEMKQRQETILPYMINTNTINVSKIHYQPEDIDDIDEEDPDDDLCI